MSLSKKHFESIASDIRAIRNSSSRKTAIRAILPTLRKSNPLFNEERFINACEGKLKPGKKKQKSIGSTVNAWGQDSRYPSPFRSHSKGSVFHQGSRFDRPW